MSKNTVDSLKKLYKNWYDRIGRMAPALQTPK